MHPSRLGRDGDVLAVVSQSGPTVSFFDAADDELLGTLRVPAEPHELLWDPVRRTLWCTLAYTGGYYHANEGRRTEILAIDPHRQAVVQVVDLHPEHGPHGLALDAARGLLFVSVEGGDDRPGGVVTVDAATGQILGRIDTGAPGPHWFAVDAAGRVGVAANKEAPYVSIVDLSARTMVGKVAVPGSEGVAVSPDGTRAYVAGPYAAFGANTDPGHGAGASDGYARDGGDGSGGQGGGDRGAEAVTGVRVIDLAARAVVDVLPAGGTVLPVHLAAGGKLLVGQTRMSTDPHSPLGRHSGGTLTVFDTATHHELGSVEIGQAPLTITSSPDGRLGYVASVVSSTVEIVDLDTLRVLNQLTIPRLGEPGAHGLAYIPRPA